MMEQDLQFQAEVRDELRRARAKFPGEEGKLTDAEWLAVLTEEVGEAAKAIQDEPDEALRAELVQVAAVAMRWAVSIPLGRVRPPWSETALQSERPRQWGYGQPPEENPELFGITPAEAMNRLIAAVHGGRVDDEPHTVVDGEGGCTTCGGPPCLNQDERNVTRDGRQCCHLFLLRGCQECDRVIAQQDARRQSRGGCV